MPARSWILATGPIFHESTNMQEAVQGITHRASRLVAIPLFKHWTRVAFTRNVNDSQVSSEFRLIRSRLPSGARMEHIRGSVAYSGHVLLVFAWVVLRQRLFVGQPPINLHARGSPPGTRVSVSVCCSTPTAQQNRFRVGTESPHSRIQRTGRTGATESLRR